MAHPTVEPDISLPRHPRAKDRADAQPAHAHTRVSIKPSDVGLLVVSLLVLVATFYVLGRLVVSSTFVNRVDDAAAEWMVDRRTPALDTLSLVGSYLAETVVKIVVTAVVAIGMWVAWRRWREPLMLVVPLVLEATAFITITYLVARPRPDVVRLDESPVDSSFPSGHVAAAAAYGALVIIVFWHTRSRWIRGIALLAGAAIPLIVGAARMYRGMHFLSDVVAGALLGLASLGASWYVLRRAHSRTEASDADHAALSAEQVTT